MALVRWQYLLLKTKPAQSFIKWLQGIHPKGFEGISLFDSINFFRREIFSAKFNDRASSVSFKFVMALPPTLLLFFTLVPYLPIKNIDNTIYDIINLVTNNPKTQKALSNIITDFYKHKKTTLLSFSILLTMFYSSNGMLGLMRQFNKALPGFKRRNLVKRRGWAVTLTITLLLSIVLTGAIFIFQNWLFDALNLVSLKKSGVLTILSYITIIASTFFTIGVIYRYGPALEKRWRLITPGSIVATALIFISTFILNYVANNLINYSKIYGSIGTLILFFLWIFYNAQILLIGFELNVSIMVHKVTKQNMPTHFDDDCDE
jgi:membrane protein